MTEENSAKRESESMAMLQKLIRIDSKDCNFHFKDFFRGFYFKVAYQQTNIENHSNDALLRQFWHHVYAHYFKKIQFEEMKRLEYLRSFLQNSQSPAQTGPFFSLPLLVEHPDFDQSLQSIFSQSYMGKVVHEGKSDKETELWLQSLYMQQKSQKRSEQMSKQRKRRARVIYSKLKQNRSHRKEIKKKAQKNQLIKKDQHQIATFIQELEAQQAQAMTPIDHRIHELEQEAQQNEEQLQKYLRGLEEKIEDENLMTQTRAYSRNIIYASSRTKDSDLDLQCLQYLIECLQQKQIAESIAKIISTERSGGETMFKMDYEKAMNIQSKLIGERQLLRMNFLRETSLINFYRTGVKSLYSFICHNYVGFRELMQNRHNITTKLKDKDIVQMMKKGACLATVTDIQHQMGKFNMCHHCKFLYQDQMLFTCSFTSDKQGVPKMNTEASCDPNLAEDFQEGPHRNRTSHRFMTRKRNCLTSYAKIHEQYVCLRKYCFSCLKDTYSHENIRENGLCPFCIGVCICTRCLRNQKIAKFKAMFGMLGGSINQLQSKSMLEHLQTKNDDQVPRGRGRPKKYTVTHIAINATKKKLRRFGGKENNCVSFNVQVSRKGKKRQHLYNHWKKSDSPNETQQQGAPKKVKRGVGRPRLHKKAQI